jgi:hypothetical protein
MATLVPLYIGQLLQLLEAATLPLVYGVGINNTFNAEFCLKVCDVRVSVILSIVAEPPLQQLSAANSERALVDACFRTRKGPEFLYIAVRLVPNQQSGSIAQNAPWQQSRCAEEDSMTIHLFRLSMGCYTSYANI